MSKLFESGNVGYTEFTNRVFMAPLTRNRAVDETDVPGELAKIYYAQRASAGLIISEATQISPEGKGYFKTPGIYNKIQIDAWKEITDAIHEEGGKIYLQLWHVGRISHTSIQPNNEIPLAPSAIQADAKTFNSDGEMQVSKPREMTITDIKKTISDFKQAAQNAKDAGFDGVEVHAANGYLIDQFIQDKTNKRTDEYGGEKENRAKLLFEVLEAVLEVWSASEVGIRLSPTGSFNDIKDSQPQETFGFVIDKLNEYDLAYLHMVERFPGIDADNTDLDILRDLRGQWEGFYIANGDYDLMRAKDAVESGHADAVAFGRPFVANPDLPKRLELGTELNEPNTDTFYGGGELGYTDYPFLEEFIAAK